MLASLTTIVKECCGMQLLPNTTSLTVTHAYYCSNASTFLDFGCDRMYFMLGLLEISEQLFFSI